MVAINEKKRLPRVPAGGLIRTGGWGNERWRGPAWPRRTPWHWPTVLGLLAGPRALGFGARLDFRLFLGKFGLLVGTIVGRGLLDFAVTRRRWASIVDSGWRLRLLISFFLGLDIGRVLLGIAGSRDFF